MLFDNVTQDRIRLILLLDCHYALKRMRDENQGSGRRDQRSPQAVSFAAVLLTFAFIACQRPAGSPKSVAKDGSAGGGGSGGTANAANGGASVYGGNDDADGGGAAGDGGQGPATSDGGHGPEGGGGGGDSKREACQSPVVLSDDNEASTFICRRMTREGAPKPSYEVTARRFAWGTSTRTTWFSMRRRSPA